MIFYETPVSIVFQDNVLFVNGKKMNYSARMLSQLNESLLEPVHTEDDIPVYLMYRKVLFNEEYSLRYDITLISSRVIGKEHSRTYGHYHPLAEDNLAYPEVYQVLSGHAKFLLQKKNREGGMNVFVVDAKEGDVMIIPPGYGHITVNASSENPLFLANVVSDNFSSDYSEYKRNHGPAVYYTTSGIKQNTRYFISTIEQISSEELNAKYGFKCDDILLKFVNNIEFFDFLNKPSLLFK